MKLQSDGYAVLRRPTLSQEALQRILLYIDDRYLHTDDLAKQLLLEFPELVAALKVSNYAFVERLLLCSTASDNWTTLLTLTKYLVRMANRCTPLGLFTAVHDSLIGEQTKFVKESTPKIFYELDGAVISEMCNNGSLGHYSRSSIARINVVSCRWGNELLYIDRRTKGDKYSFRYNKAKLDSALQLVISSLIQPKTFEELSAILRDAYPTLTEIEVDEYLGELVRCDILQSEEGATTKFAAEGEYPQIAFERLVTTGYIDERLIDSLSEQLKEMRQPDTSVSPSDIVRLQSLLTSSKSTKHPVSPLVVDYIDAESSVSVSKYTLDEVIECSEAIQRLFPPPINEELANFAKKFEEKFGDALVPILVAVDPEQGISYGMNDFSGEWSNSIEIEVVQSRSLVEKTFEKKILHALTSHTEEFDLSTLDSNREIESCAPKTFSLLFTPLNSGSGGKTTRYSAYLIGANAAGGGNLIARFAARNSNLAELYKKSIAIEDQIFHSAVVAEISHIPTPRLANVVARPNAKRKQITISGSRGDIVNEIAINDLYIAQKNNELFLWSKKLGKQVIPTLTSAHNFSGQGNLSLYSLLCAMRSQTERTANFRWSSATLSSLTVFPRIVYKNVIVSLKRWKVSVSKSREWKQFMTSKDVDALRLDLQKMGVPKLFTLDAYGDRTFEVDTESDINLFVFCDLLPKDRDSIIRESTRTFGMPLVDKTGDSYPCEVVAPIHRKDASPENKLSIANRHFVNGVRSWRRIQDCVFWKLYGDEMTVMNFILNKVAPLLSDHTGANTGLTWHFLRYRDERFHIRLRLLGSADLSHLSTKIEDALLVEMRNYRLTSYSRCEYTPELDRYGGVAMMRRVEQLFFADTLYCSKKLAELNHDESNEQVLISACHAAVQSIRHFLGSDEEVHRFILDQSTIWGQEFRPSKNGFVQLKKKYESIRPAFEEMLSEKNGRHLVGALQAREEALNRFIPIRVIKRMNAKVVNDVLSSSIHMMFNRIFKSPSRHKEFISWNYLARASRSNMSRQPAAGRTEL